MGNAQQMAIASQQPEQLVAAARSAGIRHGTEHLVDVDHVEVFSQRATAPREAVLAQIRFCFCSVIPKKKLGGKPDGQSISPEVLLDLDLPVPRVDENAPPSVYRIENVIFSSNGRTVLGFTPQTRFVKTDNAEEEEMRIPELVAH